jgi:hypothetical protein
MIDISQIDVISATEKRNLECKFRCVYSCVSTRHHQAWRLAKQWSYTSAFAVGVHGLL